MTFPPPAEILLPWQGFPVAQTPRPIVFLDWPVHIGEGGFVDGDAKRSWLAAAIDTTTLLPAGVINLLTKGRHRQPAPTTLMTTDAQACEEQFWCDRGPRLLPAFRLDISGLRQPCIVIDPAIETWWPGRNALHTASRSGGHATLNADGLTLNFPAFGGILTEFHHTEFIEYPTCVIGHPVTSEKQVPPGTAVAAVGIGAMVTGYLTTPLDGRVVVRTNGEPVAVVATS